ncbi:hypothetical protein MSAN_02329000 [Mycena sanguinolenta]|uniref:Uncharacterized protein n=1 Tax=Mycena sanguinolenta TaxID=230812 RepID=A0A8H6X872_9AGAR|nr:hypothetical protein MSAN_02329000 [Mycena sanguinolenta]
MVAMHADQQCRNRHMLLASPASPHLAHQPDLLSSFGAPPDPHSCALLPDLLTIAHSRVCAMPRPTTLIIETLGGTPIFHLLLLLLASASGSGLSSQRLGNAQAENR